MLLTKRRKETYNKRWKIYYWISVTLIFIGLIFLVRYVLNRSKVFVDRATVILPYTIDWELERDGTLRLNDPYFLDTQCVFIEKDLEQLARDSVLFQAVMHREGRQGILRDISHPYLIWKNRDSDTIHILKNNIPLDFLMAED